VTIGSDAHRLGDFNTDWETVAARVASIPGLEPGFFQARRFVRLADAVSGP
jgi:hypothetical protein